MLKGGKILRMSLLCIVAMLLCACSLSSRLRKADKYYENGEYYTAAQKYKQCQSKIPSNKKRKLKASVNYKMGDCYYRLADYARAMRYYNSAVKYKYNDSIVYLYLAKVQLSAGRYEDAARNFGIYLEYDPENISAQQGQQAALNNKELSAVSRYKVFEAKEFNSKKGSDFCLIYTEDNGTEVIFTSNRDSKTARKNNPITGVPNNDMYICRKNNSGKWESVQWIEDEGINTTADEGVVAMADDGKTLYFTRCLDNLEVSQIYKSTRTGGEWAEPSVLKLFEDSTISVGHPAVSPDGTTLYFVSDAPYGVGGKDIWYSRLVGSDWSTPLNFTEINTEGNELFPYVRKDGVLFFASDGHAGLGGLDIFMAQKDSAGEWVVTNIGKPINSQYDDFGIVYNALGNEGYFASNRGQNKFRDRLYRFELPALKYTIEGKVIDDLGQIVPDAIIRLIGDNGDNVKTRAKKDGSYKIDLKKDVSYVMLATCRGYLNTFYTLNTNDLKDSKRYENDFVLTSISRPIQMDDIFYEFGKWTLTADSENGLQQLVKILTDNPNVVIELAAHTDHVGNDKFNEELSQKRAQSVVDYLIKAGIDKERLVAKGYGESKPVEVTAEHAKKYKFLKIGQLLNEEYINTLPEEQQEICKQINRRTEFKVIKTTYNLY